MRRSLIGLLIIAIILMALGRLGPLAVRQMTGFAQRGDIAQAVRDHAHDRPVQGHGDVADLLPDDNHGAHRQRFIVRLAIGSMLLIAHNIDLAPRVPDLHIGDRVDFAGVYDWNPQGGVVHWTHRDPTGGHPPGWLTHNGRRYE